MQVRLANPRGFCAGVDRAIEIVERTLQIHGAPVYVLHEIVHNRHVLDELTAKGVRFVENMNEIPDGSVTIYSAHGVPSSVVDQGRARRLKVIDATCPLVTKVHLQAQDYAKDEREVILIGHPGHPEVEGTRGRIDGKVTVLSTVKEVAELHVSSPDRLAYVTQTTLSIDDTREVIEALVKRFPGIKGPDLKDICYATQNRQNAVRRMLDEIDLLLVVGSKNSSNSSRLAEMGERMGVSAHLIDGPDEIDGSWLEGVERVGLTAGASAPDCVVQDVLAKLHDFGIDKVSEMEAEAERTMFKMPPELEVEPPR